MSIGAYKSYDFQVSTEIHSYFQHSISLFLSLFSLHVIRVIGFGVFFQLEESFVYFFVEQLLEIYFLNSSFIR